LKDFVTIFKADRIGERISRKVKEELSLALKNQGAQLKRQSTNYNKEGVFSEASIEFNETRESPNGR
jgi:hypothetical protein